MQRRQLVEPIELALHRVVDHDRVGESGPAMHDAMANGVYVRHPPQLLLELAYCGGIGGRW